ncbi:5919_t:CDS:2, partial [Gigaspora margarita]
SISFPSKRQKKTEALQELIQIHSELKENQFISFQKPNPTILPIASILCTSEYILYWKSIASANFEDIFLYMQKKQLLIKAKEILITYEVLVYNQLVKEECLTFLTKAIKRTYNE